MQYWAFNWHGEWVGKGARWGQAVSTEGRKEDGGKRTISCYAARLCHVLGLGYCRPFINVKYVGKGGRDRQFRKEAVRTISYNTTMQSPIKLRLLQPPTTGA